MKKLLPILLILISTSYLNAQSDASRHSTTNSGNEISAYSRIEVKWKMVISTTTLNSIAIKLSTSYKPKVIKAVVVTSNIMKIEFDNALIQKEDILQVVKAEGISDPYYIEKQNRYYLDNYGFITSDPIK